MFACIYRRLPVLLLSGLALMASPLQFVNAAFITDFNDPNGAANFAADFAGNGQPLPSYSSSNGIGGSGGLDLPSSNFGNFQAVQQTGTSESFSTAGAALEVSAFFRIDAAPPNNPTDARLLDLYFVEGTTTNVAGALAGDAHVGVRLSTITNNTTYRLQARNNNGTPFTLSGGTFGLMVGNWYKLTLTATNTDGLSLIALNADIDDYGVAGTSFVANVIDNAAISSVPNAVLATDSTVFSGLRVPRGDNLSAVDNFSFTQAVPEPSTFALLGLGVLGLMVVGRRRA